MDKNLLKFIIPVFILLLVITSVLLFLLTKYSKKEQADIKIKNEPTDSQPTVSGIKKNTYKFESGESATYYKLTGVIEKEPYQNGDFYYSDIKVETQNSSSIFVVKLGKQEDKLGINISGGQVSPNGFNALSVSEITTFLKKGTGIQAEFPVTSVQENNNCDEQCLRVREEIKNYGMETTTLLSDTKFEEIQEIKISITQLYIETQE